jgi:hypothetical protein
MGLQPFPRRVRASLPPASARRARRHRRPPQRHRRRPHLRRPARVLRDPPHSKRSPSPRPQSVFATRTLPTSRRCSTARTPSGTSRSTSASTRRSTRFKPPTRGPAHRRPPRCYERLPAHLRDLRLPPVGSTPSTARSWPRSRGAIPGALCTPSNNTSPTASSTSPASSNSINRRRPPRADRAGSRRRSAAIAVAPALGARIAAVTGTQAEGVTAKGQDRDFPKRSTGPERCRQDWRAALATPRRCHQGPRVAPSASGSFYRPSACRAGSIRSVS